MRESTAKNIKFESIEDLFAVPKEFEDHAVSIVPLKNLYEYSNHPYRVTDDERMMELVESIKENGVLEPAIVRLRVLGGYEIISGHRRKRACELAGLDSMPVIIKNLPDDDAAVMMVDSNNHREELLYSEKAWAYRIKFEAMKHQGKKNENYTTEKIGNDAGESGRQIHRYIRLTYLHQDLLQMVDNKKLKFIPAVTISYLNDTEQEMLLNHILKTGIYPSVEVAAQLKRMSDEQTLTAENLDMMSSDKKKGRTVTLSTKIIQTYFPEEYSSDDIEKVLIELLKNWNRGQ